MFKRVFTKYVMAFMLIAVSGFLLLLLIITSILSNFSVRSKANLMENMADVMTLYLDMDYKNASPETFRLTQNSIDILQALLERFSNEERDMQVWISDIEGTIVAQIGEFSEYEENNFVGTQLPAELTDAVVDLDAHFYTFQPEGVKRITLVCTMPIANSQGEFCGYVSVSSLDIRQATVFENIIGSVLFSAVMVLLAITVVAYFLTERITGPLREMSAAAKKFAAGSFDVRVRVHGNDEVARLAEGFNNMAESLQHLEDMRSTFIANVSHDLRTPMTTIAGFIDSIRDGVIPHEEQGYYLQIISDEVHRLSRLVSSLLDLSRIQAGDRKFTMSPFDICEMGRLILISFEQKIEEKQLEVSFECDNDRMLVNADRDAIYQIFYNLCHNALKFSYEKGELRICIKENKEKKIVVSVYNDGEGIPNEDISRVFERFYKSDKSRGLDKTGAGLGLYIAKTIISAHGETIWVNSEHKKYCEFFFTLPRAPMSAQEKF